MAEKCVRGCACEPGHRSLLPAYVHDTLAAPQQMRAHDLGTTVHADRTGVPGVLS